MSKVALNVFAPSHPHEKQLEVLKALDEGERWVLLRAGRKFRKTSLMVSWLTEMALKTKLTCPYIAPSRIQAKNITWNDHIARLLYHFKEIGFPYKKNELELSVTFPQFNENGRVSWDGGKLQLFGVENQEGLRGISNWGAVGLDEYDDWGEDIWPLIIRPNLSTHLAPAMVSGTPKGYRNLYRLENGGLFKAFHFTSHDNPDIKKEELEAMEKEYKSMGMDYYRQEILAEYMRPYGVVYEAWPDTNYKEFDYDPFLPLHVSFDFGVNDPTAVIWIQPNGGEFRVIDYYEQSDANVEHFVQVIRSKPYKKPDLFTGDAAGKARDIASNTSPIEAYSKLGIHIRTKDGLQIPDQIRITHKHIPGLMLNSKKTERLKECLLNYKYPEKKSTMVNQSNEIPLHDEFSHGCRALEYYFANIEGGGLLRDHRVSAAQNTERKNRWAIG